MLELTLVYGTLRLLFGPGLRRLSYDWLDGFILACEQFGRVAAGIALSALLLLGACLYVPPSFRCMSLGFYYCRLAANPFAFDPDNPCAFRRLTPLLSYLVGLRGASLIKTNLVIAAALISLVYLYFRRRAPRPGDAFVAAVTITSSMVTFSTLHNAGYCDALTYVLVFILWRVRSRPVLFYSLFFVSLLNHESIAFLAPWFAFLAVTESESKMSSILGLLPGYAVALGLYLMFRASVSSLQKVKLDASYYLAPLQHDPSLWVRKSFAYWGVGAFSVFKVLWLIPVIATASLWRSGRRSEVVSILLLLACAFAQLAFAFDTSRMLTMSYMVMVVGLVHLFEGNPYDFRHWVGWLVLGNLAVPELYTAGDIVEVWPSRLSAVLMNLVSRT